MQPDNIPLTTNVFASGDEISVAGTIILPCNDHTYKCRKAQNDNTL